MRTVSRLRLLFLCLRLGTPNPNGFYFAGSSIFVLIALSNLEQAHQKNLGLDYVDARDPLVIFITARRRPKLLWWT
jgi:hypothetical protein